MAKLYIANVSRQNQIVCFRLDYGPDGELKDTNRRFEPARQQEIPPGRQVMIGGDMHMRQIEDIVKQLQPYGLVGALDAPRQRAIAPLVFNVVNPVTAKVMESVRDTNAELLTADGHERRQKAAVATNDIVQTTVAQQFAEVGIEDKPADRTDVTFEQQEQSEAGEKTIAEGYRVEAGAAAPPKNKGGRPRKIR
jgi:hypothetical protein